MIFTDVVRVVVDLHKVSLHCACGVVVGGVVSLEVTRGRGTHSLCGE